MPGRLPSKGRQENSLEQRKLFDHAFKSLNGRIGHPELAIKMADHGMDAPADRIVQGFEDRSIGGLSNAEHEPFTSTDHGAKAFYEHQW